MYSAALAFVFTRFNIPYIWHVPFRLQDGRKVGKEISDGKNDKFNYKKAEADLDSIGVRQPDRIYEYSSDKSLRDIMKENGLNPDKYYKPDNKSNLSGNSGGCYLTTACV